MTNRQWLESLSDENFINNTSFACLNCIYADVCMSDGMYDCYEGQIKWLQAEHEEKE